jgi:hypothetical protein
MSELALWKKFAELVAEKDQPECPFCGIHHKPALTWPYCDMVASFNSWKARQGL